MTLVKNWHFSTLVTQYATTIEVAAADKITHMIAAIDFVSCHNFVTLVRNWHFSPLVAQYTNSTFLVSLIFKNLQLLFTDYLV
jgi:hypothetical protein